MSSTQSRLLGAGSQTYFNAANAELDEGTKHLAASNLVRRTTDRNFHEQTIIVGLVRTSSSPNQPKCISEREMIIHRDLCTCESRACIKTNAIATSRAINFDLASIGLEVGGGIFSGDTALDSESTLRDGFLCET